MRETPSSAPASIDISAPPGMISSAGWKTSRTRPGRSVGDRGQRQPGAEQRGGVQVVAAGVGDAADGAGPGVGGAVVDGERVEVGAQRDHGPVAAADVDDQPVARQHGGRQPGLVEALGEDGRGAVLGPRELGVGVQVAPQLDQLGCEQVDRGLHGWEEGGRHDNRGYP